MPTRLERIAPPHASRIGMDALLAEIRACTLCEGRLPNRPRPILSAHAGSRILIIGQAPGRVVHETGIPWDDQSGKELRRWLGVEPAAFYEARNFALLPMGFCFPGTGASGDLPPRPECAAHWHGRVLGSMGAVKLTVLVGAYSHRHYLGEGNAKTVTENVRDFRKFLPRYLPLVHPSPRNKVWHKRNPWFEREVVPELRRIVAEVLA